MSSFFVFSALSLSYSQDATQGLGDLLRITTGFVFFWFVYNLIETEEQVLSIHRWIVLSSVLPITYGIYQFFTNTGFFDFNRGLMRINSTFIAPTVYANYLIIVCLSGIHLLFLTKKVNKPLHLVILSTALLSLILTWGRTSWVAFTAGLFVLMSLKEKRWLLIPLSALLIIGLVITKPQLSERFMEAFEKREAGKSSWQTRKYLWKSTLKAFKKRPVLGYGIGSSLLVVQKAARLRTGKIPHNDYIRLLIEVGLIGFLLFGGLIIAFFIKLWSLVSNQKNGTLIEYYKFNIALLCSYCVAAIAENVIMDVTILMFVFSLMACSYKLGEMNAAIEQI
jgi:O-antigen ligase